MRYTNTQLFKILQNDLPLESSPFKIFADNLGISEEELLSNITAAKKDDKIRRYGGVLGHRKSGFSENVMVVFDVPDDSTNDVGTNISKKPFVSHCYERERSPEWPFNLYAMVHARNEEECECYIKELKSIAGDCPFETLRSGREYKKTSLRIL